MYKIAICDDNDFERNQLENLTNAYLNENNIAAKVFTFEHPDALEKTTEVYDLYLLDVIMPMYNGIELGKILSQKVSSPIIYFTTSVDFAIDAFRLNACHYVVKPYKKDEFNTAIERAFSLINKNRYIVFELGKKLLLLKRNTLHTVRRRKITKESIFQPTKSQSMFV